MDPTEPTREAALSRLPVVHALAIRLRDAGLPDALIVRRLEMEPESLGPLLWVAETKLAAVLAATTPPTGGQHPCIRGGPSWILTGSAPTAQERP